jgi:hypothetical protein
MTQPSSVPGQPVITVCYGNARRCCCWAGNCIRKTQSNGKK